MEDVSEDLDRLRSGVAPAEDVEVLPEVPLVSDLEELLGLSGGGAPPLPDCRGSDLQKKKDDDTLKTARF